MMTVEDNGGVYFVPAFVGLKARGHWDAYDGRECSGSLVERWPVILLVLPSSRWPFKLADRTRRHAARLGGQAQRTKSMAEPVLTIHFYSFRLTCCRPRSSGQRSRKQLQWAKRIWLDWPSAIGRARPRLLRTGCWTRVRPADCYAAMRTASIPSDRTVQRSLDWAEH